MDKEAVAAEIGNEIGGYRTYSGTRKWWRGKHGGLDWVVNLKTDDDLLWVLVSPRLPSSDKQVTFKATNGSFEHEDGEVEYESASNFVEKATDIAKQSLEERILREKIQNQIKQIIKWHNKKSDD